MKRELTIAEKRQILRAKVAKRKERKENIINLIKGLLSGTALILGMFVFTYMCVDAWADEIDAHGEYNRQYNLEMDMNRVDR